MANVTDDKYSGGWTGTIDAGANTPTQLVAPAGQTGSRNRCWQIAISAGIAATTADAVLTVKDGTTVIWKESVGLGARGLVLSRNFDAKPLVGTAGNSMTFDLAAAGGTAIMTLNVTGDIKG